MPQVRRYCRDDVDAVVALFRDTVRRINSRDYSAAQVLAWAPDEIDEQRWADLLANRFTVIAEIDGVIAGFADLEVDGHLDHLYVHADHQGYGVGTALLAALHGEAARLGIARLFTEASITARPFFERHGYRVLCEQVVVVRGVEFVNYRMENQFSRGRDRMALEMSQIKTTANAHMRRDLETRRKWVCDCEPCREMRSLVGIEKLFDVRPLVREIEQIERQMRDLPEGPEMRALMDQYLAAYDKLAEAMAK